MLRTFAFTTIALCCSMGTAHAASTLGFGSVSAPTADTDNIFTATNYTLTGLTSTAGNGIFSGLGGITFGDPTFDTTTGITLTDPTFGTFTTTSVSIEGQTGASITYYVLGSYDSPTEDAVPASWVVSFTQNGIPGGIISFSANLSVPPALLVPEPVSLAMGLLGAGICGIAIRSRRRSAI